MAIETPSLDTRLGREYFADLSRIIAVDLLGRTLVRQFTDKKTVLAYIQGIGAWEGKVDSSPQQVRYAPGMIGVYRSHGKDIITIGTDKEGKHSCISLIALKSENGELIRGPGRVADYLKIDKMFDSSPIDHGCFWIGGNQVDASRIIIKINNKLPSSCKGLFYYK